MLSVDDPAMPWLPTALDPEHAGAELRACLPELAPRGSELAVTAARLVRHKPGRRCLVEYQVEIGGDGVVPRRTVLLGKVRARGLDRTSYQVQRALRNAGFGDGSADGIAVPEALGTVPAFRMWLQRRVPGTSPLRLLAAPGGSRCAQRIAEAAHKLHTSGVRPERRHTVADELRILEQRLEPLAAAEPHLAARLERVLRAARRLGEGLPEPALAPIHRDFYADQILVAGDRLYLVDLDLFCEGDPALDIGNFVGHLADAGLRLPGGRAALAVRQRELEDRFVALAGARSRRAVRVYTALTLARLVQISTLFAARRAHTETLLELCLHQINQLESSRRGTCV